MDDKKMLGAGCVTVFIGVKAPLPEKHTHKILRISVPALRVESRHASISNCIVVTPVLIS
jgi:hypothetical protein